MSHYMRQIQKDGGKKMKTKIEVQFQNNGVNVADIEKTVKEDIKAKNVRINTIANLDIYYKPEDGAIYYVASTKDDKTVENEEALYLL